MVSHIYKLETLAFVEGIRNIDRLSLYALPRIDDLQPLSALSSLTHLSLGSMKSLMRLDPLRKLHRLKELTLHNRVGIEPEAVDCLKEHPSLVAFSWIWPDGGLRPAATEERLGLPLAGP